MDDGLRAAFLDRSIEEFKADGAIRKFINPQACWHVQKSRATKVMAVIKRASPEDQVQAVCAEGAAYSIIVHGNRGERLLDLIKARPDEEGRVQMLSAEDLVESFCLHGNSGSGGHTTDAITDMIEGFQSYDNKVAVLSTGGVIQALTANLGHRVSDRLMRIIKSGQHEDQVRMLSADRAVESLSRHVTGVYSETAENPRTVRSRELMAIIKAASLEDQVRMVGRDGDYLRDLEGLSEVTESADYIAASRKIAQREMGGPLYPVEELAV